MRHLLIAVVTGCALFCVHDIARAQDAGLSMAGAVIPGVFEEGGQGPYVQFYRDVVSTAPVSPSLKLMPIKRLSRAFFERETECMYMSTSDDAFYREHGHARSDFLSSHDFNRIFMRAYTKSGGPVITGWADLKGRAIAGDEGIHVSSIAQRTLPFAKTMLYTKTVDEAFDILAAGRVDVVIAYSIDARQYFARSGAGGFQVDNNFSLLTLGEAVTCWPSPEAKRLVAFLDGRIGSLERSGGLRRTYGFEVGE